jgi:hypothetical protein
VIRAYSDALETRLREATLLAEVTFSGVVTDRPPFYCTYFLDSGLRKQGRFAGRHNFATFSLITHSVGVTVEQAQLVDEQVIAQLNGFIPEVEGRKTHAIRHEVARKPIWDRDLTPPLWLIANEFVFDSDPI